VPPNAEDISPVSLPSVIGGAILHAEPLRHGQANAATAGITAPALLQAGTRPDVDGYLAGLRDGGWSGSDDAVRTAVYASGAAKYSWFGPAMAARAARDDLGRSSYRQDTSAAAAIRRLTPLVTLLTDWAGRI
jgi:hypothetical protein